MPKSSSSCSLRGGTRIGQSKRTEAGFAVFGMRSSPT
uniref:Uncharacterized protein n=1 Tax=Globodera pallida TaxID=36090 RepID=A0A183CT62_GLOPA